LETSFSSAGAAAGFSSGFFLQLLIIGNKEAATPAAAPIFTDFFRNSLLVVCLIALHHLAENHLILFLS